MRARILLVSMIWVVAAFGDARPGARIALSADEARQCHGNRGVYLTPSKTDLQRLESLLLPALRHATSNSALTYSLRDKARAIAARMATDTLFFTATGDGFIQVDGYCTDLLKSLGPRKCPPSVWDGGSCIWRIRYSTKTQTFDRFGANSDG
jgi:hypothetical protein